ncbi:ATP-binding cassette sub-family A member 13 [Leptodactylus fuscus]|uniref:ATP-binding cassette sub-family A member 13 n=1 Tax=Leptodactylus fuscus TaxID=238119 RepID=UPI003F4E7941
MLCIREQSKVYKGKFGVLRIYSQLCFAEAIKFLQIIAPFLKNASVDQSRINSAVNKITEIFLNVNSRSCENVLEFLQINFQLQEDISFTKDITLLFCSYYESFHFSNVIHDSEAILESSLELNPLEERDTGWKEVNHLLQENKDLSFMLSRFWDIKITNENTFQIKNITSLFQYISDEMGFTMQTSQLWEEITGIITRACLSNHLYESEIRYESSIALANLCLMESYDWTTFVEILLKSLENVKRIFSLLPVLYNRRDNDVGNSLPTHFNASYQPSRLMKTPLFSFKKMLRGLQDKTLLNQLITLYQELRKQTSEDIRFSHSAFYLWLPTFYNITGTFPDLFPALKHDTHVNHIEVYTLFKEMFEHFSRFHAHNCSNKLNLPQQYYNEIQYNNRTNTDEFNRQMAAYLKCLNDGFDLAKVEERPMELLKNLFFSFLFEKYSKSLQSQIMRMKNELTNTGNRLRESHLEMSSNYFRDVRNLSVDFVNGFLRFNLQHHDINLTKLQTRIQKEIFIKMLHEIYYKIISSTMSDYLDLRKILVYMFQPPYSVMINQFGYNESFSDDVSTSEESLYNISLGCDDILHNMLSNIMSSSPLKKILPNITNSLLSYYNVSEEEAKSTLTLIKSCFFTTTVQEFFIDLKVYFSDNYSKSLLDFLKKHCKSLYSKTDSTYSNLFTNQGMASVFFLNFILQNFLNDFFNNPFTNPQKFLHNIQFDENAVKSTCKFLEAVKIQTDKDITMDDINVMLLNYVNRFQEDISSESGGEGNVTSEHIEPVLFLILSRYIAHNLTYARNLCSLLRNTDNDLKGSKYFVFLGHNNLHDLPSINILCRVISKTSNFNIFQKQYLDILAVAYNLPYLLSHFDEETNMENEILKNILNYLSSFYNINSDVQKPVLPMDIFTFLYSIHSIIDTQIMDGAENQRQHELLGSILNIFAKEFNNVESLLLHRLNRLIGSLDNQDDDDTETFLLMENISNGEFQKILQNTYEVFTNLLKETEQNKSISFLFSFLNPHHLYNDTGHFSLQHFIWQLRSLLEDDVEVKQFAKTLSEFSSWLKGNEVIAENDWKQLIFQTLHMAKALMSTYQLPFISIRHHAIIYFIEYLEESLVNPQKLSNYCQLFIERMDPEDFALLQKLQRILKDGLSVLSENPHLIIEQVCILSKCKTSSPTTLLESLNLFRNQFKNMEYSWNMFGDFNCTNFTLTSKELYDIVLNISKIPNLHSGSDCQCPPISKQGHDQVKQSMSTIEQFLPDNAISMLFSNITKFKGLRIKDILWNASASASELQSLTNISEEATNSLLQMAVSKPQDFGSIIESVVSGNCEDHLLGILLEYTNREEASTAVKEICAMPPATFYQVIVHFLQNINFRNLIYKVSIPDKIEKILNTIMKQISNIGRTLEKYQHVFNSLFEPQKLVKTMPLLVKFQQVLGGVQPKQSILHLIRSLASTICNEELTFYNNTPSNNLKALKLTDEDMKKHDIPKGSTPFCLQFYGEILQSSNGAFTWAFLKPLLHGKILYAPDVPEIRHLIYKANETFSLLENLKKYSEAWLTMSMVLKNSNQLLKDSKVTERILLNSFIRNYVERQTDLNLEALVKKLHVYESIVESMVNGSVMQQINFLSEFIANMSSCFSFNRFFPVKSSKALEEEAKVLIRQNNFLASIHFNVSYLREKTDKQVSINKLPPHVKYTIRTNSLYSIKTNEMKNPVWRSHPRKLPGSGFTYSHVFVPIQDMIDRAIISLQTGREMFQPQVQVQALPYPCHTRDLFLNHIGFFFPLIMMLSWIISVASMMRRLVYEKEIHLEEYMKMMGVKTSTNFLAWFLENIVVTMITSASIVLILKLSGILLHSDGVIVFLLVSDFGISTIMFSYMISFFFTNANTAVLCGSLLYMFSFLPYIILLVLQKQFSFTIQCLLCLLSTTAFGQGIFLITSFENEGTGIQWNKIHEPFIHAGTMSFGWTCAMIFIDSALYLTLGWYLSNIMPGPFGRRRMWNFPFTYAYWQGVFTDKYEQKKLTDLNGKYSKRILQHKGSLDENLKKGRKESSPSVNNGVTFISVNKIYPNNKMAIKGLSLRFYENQITAILGPNGAGKTTILSLLNGLYLPTLGKIYVNGKDMETELSSIRLEMGVCPQYDVLFNNLTVKEHVLLFGSLRMPMWSKRQLDEEVKQVLKDVGLSKYHMKYSYSLSGGMKRRLSVAIAFIGNTKTVVLDEPTSGVDPCSRRRIWDIMLKKKEGILRAITKWGRSLFGYGFIAQMY